MSKLNQEIANEKTNNASDSSLFSMKYVQNTIGKHIILLILFKGPRQPFESILCGYYVLRFMRHHMEDVLKSLKLKMKELKYITYGNDDMHEVQFEILELIQQNVVE